MEDRSSVKGGEPRQWARDANRRKSRLERLRFSHFGGRTGSFRVLMELRRLACYKVTSLGVYDPKGLLSGDQRLYAMIGYIFKDSFDFANFKQLSRRSWNTMQLHWSEAFDSYTAYEVNAPFHVRLHRLQRYKIWWIHRYLEILRLIKIFDFQRKAGVIQEIGSVSLREHYDDCNVVALSKRPNVSNMKKSCARKWEAYNNRLNKVVTNVIRPGLLERAKLKATEDPPSRPVLGRNSTIPSHFPVGFKEETSSSTVQRRLLDKILEENPDYSECNSLKEVFVFLKTNYPDLGKMVSAAMPVMRKAGFSLSTAETIILDCLKEYLSEQVEVTTPIEHDVLIATFTVAISRHPRWKERVLP